MRYLQIQDPMIHFKALYLILVICFATTIQTTSLSLPGCPGKCGNLAIPFPFGLTYECCFDETFHVVCDTNFDPPRPFLRLLNLEIVSISLDGKLELLNYSSTVGSAEKEGYQILPMAVEWAAGDLDCQVAQQEGARYACNSQHSQCMDSSTGRGHICRCLPGYQGSPYIPDGCQDIDECAVSNPCVSVCVNLRGSFKCYCPKGLVGDGRKDGTSCHTQRQTKLSTPVLSLIAIVVVASIFAITFGDRLRSRGDMKEELRRNRFKQNGGKLLEKKLGRTTSQLIIYDANTIDLYAKEYKNEIDDLKCNPGVKLYCNANRRTLPGTDANTDAVHPPVIVATVESVPQSEQGDFFDQLIFLAKPHKNLVRVIGCCLEKPYPTIAIVYEHQGDCITTLSDMTNITRPRVRFSREMRLKVAADVANGLAHINYHGWWPRSTRFVHGNICSASIMMNDPDQPKIFYIPGSDRSTGAASSSGDVYRDPSFPHKRSDVYSFGALLRVLLENVDEEMIGAEVVVREVAALANRCLNVNADERPNMKEVSEKLASFVKRLNL